MLFENMKKSQVHNCSWCKFQYFPTNMIQYENQQKQKYRTYLLDIADKKLTKRRKYMRMGLLNESRNIMMDRNQGYHEKTNVIENRIE